MDVTHLMPIGITLLVALSGCAARQMEAVLARAAALRKRSPSIPPCS